MKPIVRSPEEIEDLMTWADNCLEPQFSKLPSETYENGIRNAIQWLTDLTASDPREDGRGWYTNRVV